MEGILGARQLAHGSQRVYRLILTDLAEALDPDSSFDELSPDEAAAAERCWLAVTPATWNRVVGRRPPHTSTSRGEAPLDT